MSHILTISDMLYSQLTQSAQEHGVDNIEQLLEIWYSFDKERQTRQHVVQRIDQIRERMYRKYGEMPDSVSLLYEDRSRP